MGMNGALEREVGLKMGMDMGKRGAMCMDGVKCSYE